MTRKRNLTFLSAVLLVAICTNASAAAGWTDAVPIGELNQQPVAGSGSTLFIVTLPVTVNPSACSDPHSFYLDVSDERRKRLFAMLLSAQATGRSVKIYTTGTCHAAWGMGGDGWPGDQLNRCRVTARASTTSPRE